MTSLRVGIFVQHHPARAGLLSGLLAAVPSATVVVDPDPNGPPSPWRSYAACLEAAADGGLTHALVVQDDVTLCYGFGSVLHEVVASRPARVLALWHGGQPRENLAAIDGAAARGEGWAAYRSRRWVPTVALVWPARLVCPAVCWASEQRWPERVRADDEIVGRALTALHEPVLISVPSLVQHDDTVPSLVGRRHKAGLDPARVAHRYIGGGDPLTIDWASGAA